MDIGRRGVFQDLAGYLIWGVSNCARGECPVYGVILFASPSEAHCLALLRRGRACSGEALVPLALSQTLSVVDLSFCTVIQCELESDRFV